MMERALSIDFSRKTQLSTPKAVIPLEQMASHLWSVTVCSSHG